MEHTANQAAIRGTLLELPQFSHENHGSRFYRFLLEVPRLSGAVDHLPVIAREEALNQMDLSGGSYVEVRGQVRSFNNHSSVGQRLLIFVFADSVQTSQEEPCNQVLLTGTICKAPIYRRTPRRSDYLPCILWGRTAQAISQCATGDTISLTGRLQSRLYRKATGDGVEVRTAYEISALTAQCHQDTAT